MNYSIMLTLTYIFGLLGYFMKLEINFAIALFLILAVLILKKFINPIFGVVLALLFIFANFNAVNASKMGDELSNFGFKNNVVLSGRIATIPELSMNSTRLRFYLEANEAQIDGKNYKNLNSKTYVSINSKNSNFKNLQIGDFIEVKGKSRKPFGAKNPSQFDYALYLANKNVFSTFYVDGDEYNVLSKPEFIKNERGWFVFQKLDLIRSGIIEKHSKYIKSPNLEVLGGVVFGDNAINPTDEVRQSFTNSGLLHLLAASGLNVALIFGIWWFVALRLKFPYKLSIVLGMLLVIFYSLMTGFGPSILRAMIMLLFVLLGKLIDKDADGLSLIFFVGLIMLISSPQMLFDVGFQLSFTVTIALILCCPILVNSVKELNTKFREANKKKAKWLGNFLNYFSPINIIGVLSVPTIAQIAVAPIQAYYFNTFTPYSVLANLCVVPFVGIISFFGFLGSILGAIGLEFFLKIFDFVLSPLISLLLGVSNYFSNLPASIINVPSPNILQIALYYSLIFAFFTSFKNNFKKKTALLFLVVATIIFGLSLIKIQPKNYEIIAFAVENADCFLIKTPSGKNIVIDTAKLPYRGRSQASMIVNNYFKDISIKTVDLMILTHFDSDHSGGAVDIMKNFKVKKVIIARNIPSDWNSKAIMEYLNTNKINYETVKNNSVVYFEPNFTVKTFAGNFDSEMDNENSIITLVTYLNSNTIFMGDAGLDAYEQLKSYFPKNIDILKVGHHGAKNSLSRPMLKNLNPKAALISVGINNYGHPSPNTLWLLNSCDVPMFSTKEFNALKFIYDENTKAFKVWHFEKGKFLPVEM